MDPHDESGILKLVELGNDTNNCAKDNLADFSNLIYQVEYLDLSEFFHFSSNPEVNKVVMQFLNIDPRGLKAALTVARKRLKEEYFNSEDVKCTTLKIQSEKEQISVRKTRHKRKRSGEQSLVIRAT